MTGLFVGLLIGIVISYRLGYYDELVAVRPEPRILPSANHLSCGECIWLLPAAFPENRSPESLVDQLIISPWCELHSPFAWKRWNEKHLDDVGLDNSRENYRGSEWS